MFQEYCEDEDPCKNDATCTPLTTSPGYSCTCKPGYFGQHCDLGKFNFKYLVNDSFVFNSLLFSEFCKDQDPCINGNCTKLSDEPGYRCDCDGGYHGINCSLGKIVLLLKLNLFRALPSIVLVFVGCFKLSFKLLK